MKTLDSCGLLTEAIVIYASAVPTSRREKNNNQKQKRTKQTSKDKQKSYNNIYCIRTTPVLPRVQERPNGGNPLLPPEHRPTV